MLWQTFKDHKIRTAFTIKAGWRRRPVRVYYPFQRPRWYLNTNTHHSSPAPKTPAKNKHPLSSVYNSQASPHFTLTS
jgi:hypothetical protein